MKKKLIIAPLFMFTVLCATAQNTNPPTKTNNQNTKSSDTTKKKTTATNKTTTSNSGNMTQKNSDTSRTRTTNASGTTNRTDTMGMNRNRTSTNQNTTTTGNTNTGTSRDTSITGNTTTGNTTTGNNTTGNTTTGSTTTSGNTTTTGNTTMDQSTMNQGATSGQMTSTNRYAAMGVQQGSLHKKDLKFVMMANSSNMLELQASQLALQNASNASVRDFATMMVQHHTMAATEMRNMLTSKGAMIPDTAMMPRHRLQMDLLTNLKGAEFDKMYMRLMENAHEEDLDEFEDETTDARDADVRAFTTRMLPTLRTHYSRAKAVRQQVK